MKLSPDRHEMLLQMGFFKKKNGYLKVSMGHEYVICVVPLELFPDTYDIRIDLASFSEGIDWLALDENHLCEGPYHLMQLAESCDMDSLWTVFDTKVAKVIASVHDSKSLFNALKTMSALFNLHSLTVELALFLGDHAQAKDILLQDIADMEQHLSDLSIVIDEVGRRHEPLAKRAMQNYTEDIQYYDNQIQETMQMIEKIDKGDEKYIKNLIDNNRMKSISFCNRFFTVSDQRKFVK